MTLDGIMFENFILSPFVYRIVRAFASVLPQIFDVFIIIVVFKGYVFEVIGSGRTKNCIPHKYWFQLVAMYKTRMPYINVMKNF